jgi:hypothetical protein
MELNLAAQTEEMVTQLQCNSWKAKKLNSQASELASFLTVALQRCPGFSCSNMLL